jgi:hypothetical protein
MKLLNYKSSVIDKHEKRRFYRILSSRAAKHTALAYNLDAEVRCILGGRQSNYPVAYELFFNKCELVA